MGTPEFAVASLDILVKNNFNVVAVVTAPDKPAGRGQQLQQSAVKQYALANNLKMLQPTNLKEQGFIEELKALQADLQIVVAFRMLPEVVWNMPPQGTFNLHASLLPKYRGAAPINWAIINGEKETGVTTFRLKHEIDTGNILFNEKVDISTEMNAGELHDLLMIRGAELMLKTVQEIEKHFTSGTVLAFKEQDDTKATHAPKLNKETCRINWDKPLLEIHNLVRGLSPYPTAFTEIGSEGGSHKSLKIFKASPEFFEHQHPNGSLLTDNKRFLKIYCPGGCLAISELQLQDKKRMSTADFLKGFKIEDATALNWRKP